MSTMCTFSTSQHTTCGRRREPSNSTLIGADNMMVGDLVGQEDYKYVTVVA